MGWGYDFSPRVSVADQKRNAQKALEKLRKKDPEISPIAVQGRKLASTFWGLAWNQNLESYADYANRIGRGRSYVRSGMVLDLKIDTGRVTGLVMGSRKTPYSVTIRIDPLGKRAWEAIASQTQHSIGSLAELAEGKFPQEIAGRFLRQGDGLFPSPREIHTNCSCPDWADVCKHVAAVLYGIGVRFDSDPLLFFKLRDIPFEALLKKSVEEKMQSLLQNAGKKSGRVLEGEDIERLFGI